MSNSKVMGKTKTKVSIKRYCNRCNTEKHCNSPCVLCGSPEYRFITLVNANDSKTQNRRID